MKGIEVVRSTDLNSGDSTSGIIRGKAFEVRNVLFARSRVAAGVTSGWHHHGNRDLFGYLLQGTLRLDYGGNGSRFVVLAPGDFFHIPAGMIHRDVNPTGIEEAVVVSILVGEGPTVINVPSPRAG